MWPGSSLWLVDDVDRQTDSVSPAAGDARRDADGVGAVRCGGGSDISSAATGDGGDYGQAQQQKKEDVWQAAATSAEAATEAEQCAEHGGERNASAAMLPWLFWVETLKICRFYGCGGDS